MEEEKINEKEFFDIRFDELSNKNLMVQMVSQELSLFKGAGSGLINIVGENKAEFFIRIENYFLMRDFLHQLNQSNNRLKIIELYSTGVLLWTTQEPGLDYFGCFNRELDVDLMRILVDLKLTFAYTVQF